MTGPHCFQKIAPPQRPVNLKRWAHYGKDCCNNHTRNSFIQGRIGTPWVTGPESFPKIPAPQRPVDLIRWAQSTHSNQNGNHACHTHYWHRKRAERYKSAILLECSYYCRYSFKFINVSQWYDYHSIHTRCTLWGPYDWATLFKLISVHFVLNTLTLLIVHIFSTTNSNSTSNLCWIFKLISDIYPFHYSSPGSF